MSIKENSGISNVRMKFLNIRRKAGGEGDYLLNTDIIALRYREQRGLDTLVVYTVNPGYY